MILFPLAVCLMITAPAVFARGFDNNSGTKETNVSFNRTIIVYDASSLKEAVRGNYTRIIVHGTINDAEPLILKDNVTLEGDNSNSEIMTIADSDAIMLGKNNIIKNLTIKLSEVYDVNDPNSYEKSSIVNNQGASVGNFVADHVTANSGIVLHVTDASKDSIVTIHNNRISAHYKAGVSIDTQNASTVKVTEISNNIINTETAGVWVSGPIVQGISIVADTKGTIFVNGLKNNDIGKNYGGMGIYSLATGEGKVIINTIGFNRIGQRLQTSGEGGFMRGIKLIAQGIKGYNGFLICNNIIGNTIASIGSDPNSLLLESDGDGTIVEIGVIKDNTFTTNSYTPQAVFTTGVTEGGYIRLHPKKISGNTFYNNTKFPNMYFIGFAALGSGSTIDFGKNTSFSDAQSYMANYNAFKNVTDHSLDIYVSTSSGGVVGR